MLKVYGTSDDLIELEGCLNEEIPCYDGNVILEFSDGTVLKIEYGKPEGAIWKITPMSVGHNFIELTECLDDEENPYSDVAVLDFDISNLEDIKITIESKF